MKAVIPWTRLMWNMYIRAKYKCSVISIIMQAPPQPLLSP